MYQELKKVNVKYQKSYTKREKGNIREIHKVIKTSITVTLTI